MRIRLIILLAATLIPAACDDSAGPPTDGTLVVTTSTGGTTPDENGYLLTVDGVDSLVLGSTGTSSIDLPAGQHSLQLLGLAEDCSVSPETPLDVEIPSQDTTSVAFEVTCSATGARITTVTTGLDFGSNGYRVVVDSADGFFLPLNATVLTRLDPGSRTIVLTGLPSNCTIQGSKSREVTIVEHELVPVEFAVECTATMGVIGVVVEASGIDVDGEYKALVDETSFSLVVSGAAYLLLVPFGDHVVSLVPPANCSVETESRAVTLTGGTLIRDTVTVTFSVTCGPGSATLQVTVRISGHISAHGFDVWVCPTQLQYYCTYGPLEQFLGTVEPNGVLIAQVSPSTYNVELRNIGADCHVNAPNPKRGVKVPNASTIAVSFPIQC